MAVLTFDGLATPGQCSAPDWVAVPAAGPRTRPGSYNSQLVLCSAPSVPQPVFTITEKGGLVSIVSYSRPSLMIIALGTQFYVYLLWGQRLFSRVS